MIFPCIQQIVEGERKREKDRDREKCCKLKEK